MDIFEKIKLVFHVNRILVCLNNTNASKQFKDNLVYKLMLGHIYLIKSPSNKIYVGQTKYYYMNRYRDHIYDAFDPKKDHCKKLNHAIRKYGKNSFYVDLIRSCDSQEQLDKYEAFYIKIFDSVRNGYNIKNGGFCGTHNESSKKKISESLKGKPKVLSMRENLSKARNKYGLPMYVIKSSRYGYRVVNHPKQNGREKSFTSRSFTNEENLKLALEYLKELNNN